MIRAIDNIIYWGYFRNHICCAVKKEQGNQCLPALLYRVNNSAVKGLFTGTRSLFLDDIQTFVTVTAKN
jgi:hypothetical protein